MNIDESGAQGYDSFDEGVRTMWNVLKDEDDVAAAVLSVSFTDGTGDLQFVCRDGVDYWPVMDSMLAHRVEVMAARAGISVEELLENIKTTVEKRREIRNEQ